MPVHHVDMDPIGAGGLHRADFLAQLGEIRGQDGWRDKERAAQATTKAQAYTGEGPITLQWDFRDMEPWHLRIDNGSSEVARGRLESADVTVTIAPAVQSLTSGGNPITVTHVNSDPNFDGGNPTADGTFEHPRLALPTVSAALTDWESMTAAVGSGLRLAAMRHRARRSSCIASAAPDSCQASSRS